MRFLSFVIFFLSIFYSNYSFSLDTKPIITLDMAKTMANACEASQKKEGYRKVNIAIVDAGADLVLFRRQDTAFLGSINIALDKAVSSARIPFPTRLIGELAFGKDGNPAPLPGVAHSPGLVAFAGGLPISTIDGVLIGAIGVSGASADEDERCALVAIESIADQL